MMIIGKYLRLIIHLFWEVLKTIIGLRQHEVSRKVFVLVPGLLHEAAPHLPPSVLPGAVRLELFALVLGTYPLLDQHAVREIQIFTFIQLFVLV